MGFSGLGFRGFRLFRVRGFRFNDLGVRFRAVSFGVLCVRNPLKWIMQIFAGVLEIDSYWVQGYRKRVM